MSGRPSWRQLVFLLVPLVAAGCGGGGSATATPSPRSTPTATPATPTPTPTALNPRDLVLTVADLGAGYQVDGGNSHAVSRAPGGVGYLSCFVGTPQQTGTIAVESLAIVFRSAVDAQNALDDAVASLAAEPQAQLQASPADLGAGAHVYSYLDNQGGSWMAVAWAEGTVLLQLSIEYRVAVTDAGPIVAQARIMDRAARARGNGQLPTPTPSANPTATPRPSVIPSNNPGSCFGCVTITDVQLGVYAASPDVMPECLPRNVDLGGRGQVIGPNVSDPNRTFDVGFRIRVANNGTTCGGTYSGTVRLASNASGGPMEIQRIAPAQTFELPAGQDVSVSVTVHVPEGNTYDGPMGLDVYVGS